MLAARRAAVIADPTHIHQLIMNLCRNAEHAMSSGGKLTVSLDVIDANEDAALSHGLLPAGRYIRLRVEDTGCGMTPEVAARILEPFFTTRAHRRRDAAPPRGRKIPDPADRGNATGPQLLTVGIHPAVGST
jgi:signal transduction histidine kinase